MVLERHPGVLRFLLDPLTQLFKGVHPNVITWMSLPFAAAAAYLFYASNPADEPGNWFLLIGALMASIMGILDLLDGRIARLTNKASKTGDFLDHVMDRFLDVLLITGIAFSPWADLRVGFFALVGTLLTSYMGTQAQAVGAGRLYGGILTRADRIVLMLGAPIVDHFFAKYDYNLGLGYGADYALGLVLYYFAIMGIFTALQRFVRVLLHLRKAETPP
jgi:archaetidylinositol phosphate synthase